MTLVEGKWMEGSHYTSESKFQRESPGDNDTLGRAVGGGDQHLSERYLKVRNRIATAFLLSKGEELYSEVLRIVLEEVDSPFGFFGYIEENGDLISPSMTRDVWDACRMPQKSIRFSRSSWSGLWGQALVEKRTMVANEGLQVPQGHISLSCAMAVPILFGDELIGQIAVANKKDGYGREDAGVLENLARSVAPLLKARLDSEWHDRRRREVEAELRRFRAALDNSADAVFLIDRQEMRFIDVNTTACRSLDYDREILLTLGPHDIKPEYDLESLRRIFDAVIGGDDTKSVISTVHRRADGSDFPVEVVLRSISSMGRSIVIATARDITERIAFESALKNAHEGMERKVEERTRELTLSNGLLKQEIEERRRAERRLVNINRLLELAAGSSMRKDYLEGVIALLKEWTGCRHIGIRVVDESGLAQFTTWTGYNRDFLASESYLLPGTDRCICARVISGERDKAERPFLLTGGTFWCGDTVEDLTHVIESRSDQYRGECIAHGFRTLAVVPIKYRDMIIGAVHVADEKKNAMGSEVAVLVDAIGPLIGEAMKRFEIEEELHRNYDLQSVTTGILNLSYENMRLERVLEQALALVPRVPWLVSQCEGVVALFDHREGRPRLAASHGLSEKQKRYYDRADIAQSPYGAAVRTGRITYVDHAELRDAARCAGFPPHGLYSVPVKAAGRVLAVLIIHVNKEHKRRERDIDFLCAVADTLAAVIQRKSFEERLREREERFRQLAENINEAFWLAETESGEILYVSPAAHVVFGVESPDVRTVWEMMETLAHPDDAARVRNAFLSFGHGGTIEYRVRTAGGAMRWVRTRMFPIKNEQGKVFRIAGLTADITAYKEAAEREKMHKEQLIQADKMASLGILVSGVAHEINNPNNLIMLNADVLAKAWRDALPVLDGHAAEDSGFMLNGLPYKEIRAEFDMLLDGVTRGSERIKRIVNSLKDFVRVDTGALDQEVEINTVAECAIFIVGNLVKKSTRRFSWTPAAAPLKVKGNAQQLEQVVINLITNACQALESIDAAIVISTECDDGTIRIKVMDEGKGIRAEDTQRIMDPFYTTKRDCGGTGLGLAVSFGIVKAHGGVLRFESRLGKGTTAIVELPVMQNGEIGAPVE
ncbi:MAG: PAS domain S-box protein [Chitinivibrionales bacterium]|nr:PAS domain S-box protein [Chitinivibrionales bacterium]MBD3355998.1 PAS domain S-box protein [Chitinivibrionales bacterium]